MVQATFVSTMLAALVVAATPAPAAAQPSLDEAVVLVIGFADGRTVHKVVTAKERSSWTPMFPRLADAVPDGSDLEVAALKHRGRLTADGVVTVAVSLLRGSPHQREDHVATVDVGADEPVTVEGLRAFGVAPVTLSLQPLTSTTLYPPRVENHTSGLEVMDIEVLSSPAPRYRVTVRNLTAQPAVSFHVRSSRDDRPMLSGVQGHPDASPIVDAHGSYSFTWNAASGPPTPTGAWAPRSHDVFELTAVLWEDGSVEGDGAQIAPTLARYLGRRLQLARGVAVLRTVQAGEVPALVRARLRSHLERLSIEPDAAMRQMARSRLQHVASLDDGRLDAMLASALASTRKGILEDLLAAPDEPDAFRQWLAEVAGRYERWIGRFLRR